MRVCSDALLAGKIIPKGIISSLHKIRNKDMSMWFKWYGVDISDVDRLTVVYLKEHPFIPKFITMYYNCTSMLSEIHFWARYKWHPRLICTDKLRGGNSHKKRSAMLVISLIKDSVLLKVFIIKCHYLSQQSTFKGALKENNNN